MTYDEIIRQYRIDSDDLLSNPYLATQAMVIEWLNEAEEEAAIRSRLLRETVNPDLCEIAVTVVGGNTYPLHTAVAWVTRADFIPDGQTAEDACQLHLVSDTELDRLRPRWRTTTEHPRYLMVDDSTVQLGCLPLTDGLLKLEVCRVPLDRIEDRDSESPEIARAHHRGLVSWMLYRNYSRPDSQVFDPDRAKKEYDKFEMMFGTRPNAKMRRDEEADRHHANRAW